ncbi:hypothetical protein CQ054_21610 [Ochrobactrum sp. MYb29]|nr:hypothetical protein CQ054_21610 [Ochrobactrum sp. MYb29]
MALSLSCHRQIRRYSRFMFSRNRDLKTAKRFICKALARHGRPEKITIDGSQTNRMAIIQCDAENRLLRGGRPILIAPANT